MKYKIIILEKSPLSVKQGNSCIEQAKKFGITVEKFDAVDGLYVEQFKKEYGINRKWNFKKTHTGVDGCFFSHYKLWKECVEANEPYCILEHDGYFIREMPSDILDHFTDVMKLDHLSPGSYYYREELDAWKNIPLSYIRYYNGQTGNRKLNETGCYLKGAYSYIIKPSGAKKLIEWINNNGYLPADVQIGDAIVDIKVTVPTIARLHPDYYNDGETNTIEELSLTRNLEKHIKRK